MLIILAMSEAQSLRGGRRMVQGAVSPVRGQEATLLALALVRCGGMPEVGVLRGCDDEG